MSFNADGRLIASGADKQATIWDASSEKLIRNLEYLVGSGPISFGPTGTIVAPGNEWNVAKVLDGSSDGENGTLTGQDRDVRDIPFGPDNKRIATSGLDGEIHVLGAPVSRSDRIEFGAART